MKSDRVLTLEEVLSGKVSKEYLDEKERVAVATRRLRRLCDERFDIEDKIAVAGSSKALEEKLLTLTEKIEKLKRSI